MDSTEFNLTTKTLERDWHHKNMEVQHPKKINLYSYWGKIVFFHKKKSRARFWRRKSKLKIWGGGEVSKNTEQYTPIFLSFPWPFFFLSVFLFSFPSLSLEKLPEKYWNHPREIGTLYNPYNFFISEYITFLGSPCSSSCEALKDDFMVNKITTCINHMFSRLLLKL